MKLTSPSQHHERYLETSILNSSLVHHKMAFISGPRQVGKTSLARSLSRHFINAQYYNWDEASFKRNWAKDPHALIAPLNGLGAPNGLLVIFDEIHKSKKWKTNLKGIFDHYQHQCSLIVTGSARLNIYRKGADSLLGRYFHFRLNPLSQRELCSGAAPFSIKNIKISEAHFWTAQLLQLERSFSAQLNDNTGRLVYDRLFQWSGFPEPYFKNQQNFFNLWKKQRQEKIIKEDFRDLSNVHDISQVEILASLLPERIGSPLSLNALKEDLQVSYDSTKRWMSHLMELYYIFPLSPYSRKISRSLKKERKIYFYDWTQCHDHAQVFENMTALHLLKFAEYCTDIGEGEISLHYVRDKDKNEVDFLLTLNHLPWLLVECKLKPTNLNKKIFEIQKNLNVPLVQLVYEDGVFSHPSEMYYVMSANIFFNVLV